MNKHTLLVAAASLSVLSSAATAQVVGPSGIPLVGTSAGPYCNSVTIGGEQLAVPNTDMNAAALLVGLSAAEFRGQSVVAVLADGYADCYGLLAGTGSVLPHLIAYK